MQEGSVRYIELDGEEPRDVRVDAGDRVAIAPRIAHHVEPSRDARFFVQFHRAPGDPFDPAGAERRPTPGGPRTWEHRRRDLDTTEEMAEFVTRQYVAISEDPVLARYFAFAGPLTDWYSQVLAGTDFWSKTLFEPPNRQVDAVLERFRHRHEQEPFTAEAFDRWLEVFRTTVDGGWTGAQRRAPEEARHRHGVGHGQPDPREGGLAPCHAPLRHGCTQLLRPTDGDVDRWRPVRHHGVRS